MANSYLPDGWRRGRISDVAEVVGGSTPSRANADYWGGDIPWVAPSELTELPGRCLDCSRESISEQGLKAAGLRVLPPGSVLLTSRATIGATAINKMPVTTNQGFQSLIPKRDTDGLWLYYGVSALRQELERRGAGSTFREVSRDGVRSLPILIPPLDEQRAIAAVLDSIDEAIERTEEVIAATERLRDALLHDLLTRGLPGRHTEWKEVRGLGTIPACWRKARLGELGRFINGRAFKPSDWEEVGLPIIRIQNLTNSDAPFNRYQGAVSEDHLIDNGDIVVSWSASIEARTWNRGPGILNQHIFKVSEFPEVTNKRFLFFLLEATMSELRRRVHGTTMQHVTKGTFDSTPCALPPLEEQREIATLLDSIDQTLERNSVSRDTLVASRASTSDALLTGRARPRDGVAKNAAR